MNEYFERMREDVDRQERSKLRGLTNKDVVAKKYTTSEFQSLVASLRERPQPSDATFRLASFVWERQSHRIPPELRREAADNVADLVSTGGDAIREDVARIFVAWGQHRSDYRAVSQSLFRHASPDVRMTALSFAASILDPAEIPTLFDFHRDSYIGETGGMGGPLRYLVRDHALAVLEWLTGSPKSGDDCFEDTPHGRVFYRSWSTFLNWYEANKRGFDSFRVGS